MSEIAVIGAGLMGHGIALDALCAEGRSGVMAGRGFFGWSGRAPADLFQERDAKLLALKKAFGEVGRMRKSGS